MDGAGCAVVFKLAHHNDNEASVIYCSNADIDQKTQAAWDNGTIDNDTSIYFSDICPSKEMLEKLAPEFNKIRIFDHHKTNLYAVDVIPNSVIKHEPVNGKLDSGTSLLYKYYAKIAHSWPHDRRALYFNNPATSQLLLSFIDTIRSYDTYEWKATNNLMAKKLQTLFSLIGMQKFVDKYLARLSNPGDSNELIEEQDMTFIDGKINQEQEAIDNVTVDKVFVKDVKGYKCALKFTSGSMNISELSHQFLTKNPEIDVFIGINLGSNELSYRAVKKIDTGAVFAKPNGGGGHILASGSPIPDGIREQILSLILDNIK